MPVLFAVSGVAVSHAHDFAVGWGTLSLINAGLAQSKNRSGLAWWFVSLFLGPVATFFLVVLDKVEPQAEFRKAEPTPEL